MRHFGWVFAVAGLSAFLAGCAGTEDDVANYLTDQTKYEFYSCPQIAQSLEKATKQIGELERAAKTASKDAGGQTLSAISYRPELLKQRGNINALLRTAHDKHCNLPAPGSDLKH